LLSLKAEAIAEVQVNGIGAVPYHARIDAKDAKHQDMFLMEDVDVVVATIAFGMELINDVDVRFVS
jgi:ATP-dependent DNA helicase RecQ